ncbi:MAG: hypothetical protein LBS19_05810 [Clostridiales bacterium]|jgi:hypothetical protein|nr:hypothetical protein [Clostridiales bacterium]
MSEPGMNFMKMFEIFGGSDNPDYDRMLKFMELIAAFRRLNAVQDYQRKPDPPPNQSSGVQDALNKKLEVRLRTPELMMIKSAIPMLEPKHRKNMRIIIKLIEIQRLMDVCREVAAACNIRGMDGDGWRTRMLSHLRPHLSRENRLRVDALIKMMEINGILSHIKLI